MKTVITNSVAALIILSAVSCKQETTDTDYIARVNDSYLTREEYSSLLDTVTFGDQRKNEIITKWIHRELLYQTAIKEGIVKSSDYERILNQSSRELAGAMLLQRIIDNEKLNITTSEAESFYNNNKNEFSIPFDSFVLNLVEFLDEEKAIQFRNIAVDIGWEKAVNQFSKTENNLYQKSNRLLAEFEITPASLSRMVNELYPNEISIVISTRAGYYTVVQLIEKLPAGTVPPFVYVKQDVIERVAAVKRQQFIDDYLKDLYSSGSIEIKNQD